MYLPPKATLLCQFFSLKIWMELLHTKFLSDSYRIMGKIHTLSGDSASVLDFGNSCPPLCHSTISV